MLGQEVCEDAERYGVAAARRIETTAGSVFIRYSLASCAFVFGQFLGNPVWIQRIIINMFTVATEQEVSADVCGNVFPLSRRNVCMAGVVFLGSKRY
jgi:hypothetical protein